MANRYRQKWTVRISSERTILYRSMHQNSPEFRKACLRLLGSDSELTIAIAKRFDPVLYARIEAHAVRLRLEGERKLMRRMKPENRAKIV